MEAYPPVLYLYCIYWFIFMSAKIRKFLAGCSFLKKVFWGNVSLLFYSKGVAVVNKQCLVFKFPEYILESGIKR